QGGRCPRGRRRRARGRRPGRPRIKRSLKCRRLRNWLKGPTNFRTMSTMLHDIRLAPRPVLSPGERDTLVAMAEAALPAGKRFPAGDARTVARMESYLGQLGPGAPTMIRGILHAVDASAYTHHLRPFARLDADKRLRLLESWRTGN